MRVHQVESRRAEITIMYPSAPFVGIPSHNGGDGDGGYVCFICDKSMDKGESFICVSRRWETSEDREGTKNVIDAMASLQVCRQCTLLSAHHELRWVHKPKLVDLEVCGFYMYTRLLADAIARIRSDTRAREASVRGFLAGASDFSIALDTTGLLGGTYNPNAISIITNDQCYNCRNIININKPHLVIEITVDTPTSSGITQSNVMLLGKYCNECSGQLLPLCDHLW